MANISRTGPKAKSIRLSEWSRGKRWNNTLNSFKNAKLEEYGQIHAIVREMIVEKFGEEQWRTILKKSGLDEHNDFLVFHRFDDTTTFKLIGTACEVLKLEPTQLLEAFGEYFLSYCLCHGYDKMIKTLGGDFEAFIQNIDSLHSLLALSYKDIEAPSFRCEKNPDKSLTLHYYTIRPGLYPIALGLVRAVARDLYHQDSEITVLEKSQEHIEGGRLQEHVQFKVVLKTSKEKNTVSDFQPTFAKDFTIGSEHVCKAFPYHIVFDADLKIKQCGTMIQKLLGMPVSDRNVRELFELVHPRMEMTVVNIRMFINAVFMLKMTILNPKRQKNCHNGASLVLKGQMVWMDDIKHVMFISSPRLSSLTELIETNVYISDIPLYDITRELVLLNQQRIAEIDIAKKLDETTMALKKISADLDIEKKKTEQLLYQMLPKKVADSLKNGLTVEAEKFDHVTILFSDIVSFTNIAAACPAMAVVNMLNDMYQRFDAATTVHGVYKVETIGDAYMIVCGVPTKTDTHAQPVANFAMDMIEEGAQVKSPATGKPLQIRVGIHTGPVVAGVVGQKMPRYCLFGDTVNTASRMESHGVPGRVHLSPTTYDHLKESKIYKFRCRGDIDVKGKGRMTTFFLVGTTTRKLMEPDDECNKLKVIGPKDTDPDITYPKMSQQLARPQTSPFVEETQAKSSSNVCLVL